jgi:aryl-alcohol dehydrogenase-like predicted oxidoreductase
MARIEALNAARGRAPWVCAQNRFNLIDGLDDPHLLPASRELGFGLIPYMPLASGILTGKYLPGQPPPRGTRAGDQDETVVRELHPESLVAATRLKPWAEARGRTLAELAMGWLASHAEVSTIIPSARTLDQLEANVAAADWRLTADEMAEARAIAVGAPASA